MTKVVFIDGSALQLESYTNQDGIIRGDVVNGGWCAVIDTVRNLLHVEDTSTPRPYVKLVEVKIPRHIASRDYNKVIGWAEKQASRVDGMKFMHPRFMYIVVSDRDDNKILSSATSIKAGRKMRAQFEYTMGQGVEVKLYKVEELTEVEE